MDADQLPREFGGSSDFPLGQSPQEAALAGTHTFATLSTLLRHSFVSLYKQGPNSMLCFPFSLSTLVLYAFFTLPSARSSVLLPARFCRQPSCETG